ncbi:MAG: glutamine--fructose-6-phosphate transaminase (isomerizing) [Patescibacteria group bacterium]
MCGIIGYIGNNKSRNAIDVVLRGLKQLEYRGYDSAGLTAFINGGSSVKPFVKKTVGKVSNLEKEVGRNPAPSLCAIAHTRWATHGVPSERNAHPHYDCKESIYVVHNGIIENYKYLKEVLNREGHKFTSETDSEVLAHLVERHLNKYDKLEDAVIGALQHVEGAFAIAVVAQNDPYKIVVARRSSPLIIGLPQKAGGYTNEYFIASDASAITEYTKKIIYLDDDEIAVLTPNSFSFYDYNKTSRRKAVDTIDWSVEQARKSGFPHFMLKEIFKQPETIKDSLRGRLLEEEGRVKLGGLEDIEDKLKNVKRIVITACGTAYYAGLAGKYILENIAKIPVEVDLASEFRYRSPVLEKDTAVLALSQSGETADTLAALDLAKKNGNLTLGIVNAVGSTVSRVTDAGVYNHIGPEIGVASTKAFTSQVAILTLFALSLGRQRNLKKAEAQGIIKALHLLPSQIKKILEQTDYIKSLAEKYNKYDNFLFLGRNYDYPTALEGALKLKEISYIHSEGYAAGEMKHGTIALIDKNFPTMAIVGNPISHIYPKMVSNLEEIKARSGPIVVVAIEGDKQIENIADDVIYIPKTHEALNPILAVVPLQLFAYYMAVLRGLDPDKPRNLAKSVTVE